MKSLFITLAFFFFTCIMVTSTTYVKKDMSMDQILKTDHYREILDKGISQFIDKASSKNEIVDKKWVISQLKGFHTKAAAGFKYLLELELKNPQNEKMDVELEIFKPFGFHSLYKLLSYKIKEIQNAEVDQ